jgi:nucleoside-diphosphate-sugar epimerase
MSAPAPAPVRRVLVTGAGGNLGAKLIARLLEAEWCEGVIGVDRTPAGDARPSGDVRVERIEADLADPRDGRWREALARADALVHLAAQNPAPSAPWTDASASFDQTANLVGAAQACGVRRLVFASSNHVMGQYKDPPLADTIAPGTLATDLPPGPGTSRREGGRVVRDEAYAVSKLMSERLCVAAAGLSGGALTAVAVRIGWCQPGENRPETINATGIGTDGAPAEHDPLHARDLAWFRHMWLSNRDFVHLMERALVADAGGWPAPGIVVNGMSANAGMPWDIAATGALLGYAPQDDIRRHLA